MKKGLSILLVMGMLLTLTAIPSFADEGEKQKPNPDVGVMLQADYSSVPLLYQFVDAGAE